MRWAPSEKRPDLSANEVANKWREIAGEIPGLDRLAITPVHGGPGGNPIEIQLIGKRFDQLMEAADDLKKEIATYPGAFDINDDFRPGKEEKRVYIKEGAKSVGVTMADIARQLRLGVLWG